MSDKKNTAEHDTRKISRRSLLKGAAVAAAASLAIPVAKVEGVDIDPTDTPAIVNRLNSVVKLLDTSVGRLNAIRDVLVPQGPPADPAIIDVLHTVIARSATLISTANHILNPAVPP